MQRVGIVDLGSNTARLVVYTCKPGAWFRLTDQIREPVRLAEGIAASGLLSEAAIERALAALRLYVEFASDTSLDRMDVIATSAVREAGNREPFLARVRDELGLEISVLEGADEAEYGVLAVANSFWFEDAWVVDLGGGTAQVSEMRERAFAGGNAYPLGAVRLTESFLASDPPTGKQVGKLEAEARARLEDVLAAMNERRAPLVAMGGTVRNLARATQKGRSYPLSQLHGFFLSGADLNALIDQMLRIPIKKRARIAGIKPDRADVILGGALVFKVLIEEGGHDGLYISGQGLREGAFYRQFLPPPHLVPEARSFGVQNLFALYAQPIEHTERVRFLARRIFDELEPLHGYGSAEARLLDEAAMLHDIGMAVGYHEHHKHGAYLVDTAFLPGMDHRDLALVTLLVRYHRKGKPKPGPYSRFFSRDDRKLLQRLTTCLRIAEYLERARAGRIRDVRGDIGDKNVRLELLSDGLPLVEIWETQKHAWLFEAAFGRRLDLGKLVAPAAAG